MVPAFELSLMKLSRLLVCMLALAQPILSDPPATEPRVHIIITTECGEYFTWQSIGFFYSFRKIGQRGNLTRVMCCTESARKNNPHLQIVPTHVAPDYTHHPTNGDVYLAYNKPLAVIDWINKTNPDTDYVLVIDADMIMMRQMDPVVMGVKPGIAVAAYFDYLKGTHNELADKHIPEIAPRNDTLAGKKGRKSDQCGGFTFMTKNDIAKVAPLWLKYTEDVRFDPDGWRLTGDVYATKPGLRPWISEMYGYSYGAAKAGVWHIAHRSGMLYPGYDIVEAPYVLHYGLHFSIKDPPYTFDKHWYTSFDALRCPPWDLGEHERSNGGLFPHPPRPSELKTQGDKRYRDVHAITVVNTLNEAFCERHYQNCEPSEELDTECRTVHEISMEVYDELVALEAAGSGKCRDFDGHCVKRAEKNECSDNAEFMQAWCRRTCGFCTDAMWTDRPPFIAEWQKRFMKDENKAQADKASDAEGFGRRGLDRKTKLGERDVEVTSSEEEAADNDTGDTETKDVGDQPVAEVRGEGQEGDPETEGGADAGDGSKAAGTQNKNTDDTDKVGSGSVRRRVKAEAATVLDFDSGVEKNWASLIMQIHGFGALMWVALFILFIMLAPRVRRARTPSKLKSKASRVSSGRLDSL